MQDQSNKSTWPPVRRRKRRPKWLRILHKYWPPIRFGLIVLALLAVLIIGINAIINSARQDSVNNDTTPPPETGNETTEATLSQADIQAMADDLIKQANFIAAGYDYTKAINMLQNFEYFDSVPALADLIAQYKQLDSQLVSYPRMDSITHVFFHSLIVDPDRAFDDEYTNGGYNQYMTTIDEFNAILQQMYDRGYVLVTPYDIA